MIKLSGDRLMIVIWSLFRIWDFGFGVLGLVLYYFLMQAVILAGGRGVRMNSLTDTTPKPMLSVLGKNLLEYKLDILPPEIDEVVLVIGYLGEVIKNYFGNEYKDKKIKYVHQSELRGTAEALSQARPLLGNRFVVMMGDDIYSKTDLDTCLKFPWSVLIEKVKTRKLGAKVLLDQFGHLKDIVEKTVLEAGMFNNAGLYVLSKEIFDYPLVKIPNGEFGLPQTLISAAKDFDVKVIEASNWYQITSPEDIVRVETELKKT